MMLFRILTRGSRDYHLLRASARNPQESALGLVALRINAYVKYFNEPESSFFWRGWATVGVANNGRGIAHHKSSPKPQSRIPSTAREKSAPLLLSRPIGVTASPPDTASCPTLAALDTHIQRHSYHYSLRYVASGLMTLSILAPAYPVHDAASATDPGAAQADAANPSMKATGTSTTSNATTQPEQLYASNLQDGAKSRDEADVPRHPTTVTATVAQVAKRLALLGRHQMRNEVDLASMALCIKSLSVLDMELSERVHLAVPFALRLREPAYFFSMRQQAPDALMSVLDALGKLPLNRHVQRDDIAPIAQVRTRW